MTEMWELEKEKYYLQNYCMQSKHDYKSFFSYLCQMAFKSWWMQRLPHPIT